MQNFRLFFNEKQKCLYLLFNEKQKCLYQVFNESTKCLLFHFLNALFPVYSLRNSATFSICALLYSIYSDNTFSRSHSALLFIEPLSCFSLRCKQHCLILWRKYLIEATGWFVQHAIVVHIFSAKYRFNASANFFAFLTWTAYSTGLYGSPSITGTCHTKIHFSSLCTPFIFAKFIYRYLLHAL